MRILCTYPGILQTSLLAATLASCTSLPAQEILTPQESGATVAAVEPGGSSVRIVRLSQVRGEVQMDRNIGRGFEPAFANIPVVAGARLRTGQGVAEVEFEDNSSLRLAPETEIAFEQLSRSASGATETAIHLQRGLAYVGLAKDKGNVFSISDGAARIVLLPGTHMRLDSSSPQAELAVFDGGAQVTMGGTVTTLAKRESVELNPAAQTVAAVSKGNDEGVWDGWNKQENDYHKQKASFAGISGLGQYGANDLNYYGSFTDLPGCGQVWRPYFATAAWNPFSNGSWAYYPSAGYSWVSPYPWGWLPYHSGSWASCGAAGWGWRPGGAWYGLNNQPVLRVASNQLPHAVPIAPGRGGASLIPVNTRPLPVSGLRGTESFEFRRDSAGIGIPRAVFGNLHGPSQTMERHGLLTHGVSAFNSGVPTRAGIQPVRVGGGGGAATGLPGLSRAGAPGAARSGTGGSRSSMAQPSPGFSQSGGGFRGAPSGMPTAARAMGGASAAAGGSGAKR